MNSGYCEELKAQLIQYLTSTVDVKLTRNGGCALRTPFFDSDGDPIHVIVYQDGDSVRIEDTSTIAGHLFTLGQHALSTPAFRLLSDTVRAYGCALDFDHGTVVLNTKRDNLLDGVMDLAKIIVTMVTATPFIRVQPHRAKPGGYRRLRTRIKREYESRNILRFVEDTYELRGISGVPWPIDFHWWTDEPAVASFVAQSAAEEQRRIESPLSAVRQHVYVVTANFNVHEPMAKANYLTTLAVDAQRQSSADELRIVVDHQNPKGSEALSLLRTHSDKLGFRLYDFDVDDEREFFVTQSVKEITERAQSWREFWQEHRPSTFVPS